MDIPHKTYKGGETPRAGDLVYNPAQNGYGVCVDVFGSQGWAKIKWSYKTRAIVRPIYNVKLIKRSTNASAP